MCFDAFSLHTEAFNDPFYNKRPYLTQPIHRHIETLVRLASAQSDVPVP